MCVPLAVEYNFSEASESEHLQWDSGIALIKLRFEQCVFKERPSSIVLFVLQTP